MSLQLNLQYADLLQLVQQMSVEELLQLKKDVNTAIETNNRIPQLLHYLIDHFEKIENPLSKNELQGLVYLIDFGHYALYEQSITGFTYQKTSDSPFAVRIEEALKELEEKGILMFNSTTSGDVLVSRKPARFFKSLHLSKTEKDTIQKALAYFEDKEDLDFFKEIQYHFAWIAPKVGEIIAYEKAKFCDFEWLDYFYDKSKKEFEELKQSREAWNQDADIQDVLTQIKNL